MSEPENFLSRWSRLKREGEAAPDAAPAEASADAPAPAAPPVPAATPAGEDPAFDLSKLPSLDSIGADTDVSVFLQSGVPSALRHAALRRAWASDPAIRDFRGLQENDWDFTAPDSVPGFGTFKSDAEVEELVQRLFGGDRQPVSHPDPKDSRHEPQSVQATTSGKDLNENRAALPPSGEQTADARVASAEQQDADAAAQRAPRRHGGALPQ